MNFTDIIGFIGVALLLIAFFLNLNGIIEKENIIYISLNITGALLACLASLLIDYLPFIILEGCWALVSLYAFITFFRTRSRMK